MGIGQDGSRTEGRCRWQHETRPSILHGELSGVVSSSNGAIKAFDAKLGAEETASNAIAVSRLCGRLTATLTSSDQAGALNLDHDRCIRLGTGDGVLLGSSSSDCSSRELPSPQA